MLYSVPASAPAELEVIAFPGDAVTIPGFGVPLQPGATGHHPHAGGLLSVLHRKYAGRNAAIFVVEPACLSHNFAVYSHMLDKSGLTASGEPLGYPRGDRAATHAEALLASVRAHLAPHGAPLAADGAPLHAVGFSKG